MPVIALPKRPPQPISASKIPTKSVPATQKSIDMLPLGSGTWRVLGIPGLYVRCRTRSRSFMLQRRVKGRLIKLNLGPLTVKEAKEKAMDAWSGMRRKPSHGQATFAEAFEGYMQQATLAEATVTNYRVNFDNYLLDWHARPVRDIGTEREDLRALHQRIKNKHGAARANQVRRLLSAIYNWHREGSNDGDTLPAFPKKTVPIIAISARDWAYDDAELRAWWHAVEETKKHGRVERGVKTLSGLKRAYWLTSLFSGARPRSVENLKWSDIDFEKRTVYFRVTKANRPYLVPLSDALHSILVAHRDSPDTPPSEWVFPSERNDTGHLIGVKNDAEGVGPKYRLRHTFRTRLAGLGFNSDQAKMLMGHSLGGDVSLGYISAPLLAESLRPVVNALAAEYLRVLGVDIAGLLP